MGKDEGPRENVRGGRERRPQRNGAPTKGVPAKGVLADAIAHGLDEELSAILRELSAAMAELPAGAAVRERIVAATQAAERAGQLNRQLLAHAGRGQAVARPLDLNALVREKVELLELNRVPNVTLRLELDHPLPAVEGDAEQVQRAIGNLLTNAAEAIGTGLGTVTVVTGTTIVKAGEGDSLPAFAQPPVPGRYVILQISDDGCGMDEEVQERMFAPFFSTKGVRRGLGLTAVLGAVRSQRGGIEVTSHPGQGTTVTLFFPLADYSSGADLPSAGSAKKASDNGAGRRCVLVIDDELDVREAVTDILTIKELDVLTAADGKSGLQLYHENREDVDLVLLDLSMPKMGGEETCRRLREIDPSVRVLVTSGYDQGKTDAPLARLEPDGFLPKPYDMQTLVDAVFELLEERVAN